jgi:hypothetical protein
MTFIKFAFVLLLSTAVVSKVYASCGSATCPLNNHHYLTAGWIHFMLAYEYINQDQIYVGPSPSFVGALPNRHDEVQTINQRSIFDIQYGISDVIAFNVEVPFIHRNHSHIAEGQTESFNFSGLGDIIVGGQYALLLPSAEFDPYLSFQVSVKLPSGVTDATSTEGELAEVTLQPGTGSHDAIFGVNYRQSLFSVPTLSGEYGALPLTAGVSYQISGKGTNDYRFGNTLLVYVGTQYELSNQISVLLQVNGMFRGFASIGTTGEFPQNTGGTWIFVSPGLSLHLSDALSAFGYLQLPAYLNVHGIQQTSRFNLQFGLSADIDLFE